MKNFLVLAAAALSLAMSTPGLAQTAKDLGELKREIESLKAGQLAIQKDLADIKSMLLQREVQNLRDQLQARPAAQGAGSAPAAAPTAGAAQETLTVVSIDGGAVKGDANAKITLVEFTDYQCPFCSRHYRDTMPQIIKDYVDTGKVKYVLREFPLEAIHPLAFKASEAAQCAGEQGKYWEMHDRLFANQNALAQAQLLGHGEAIALDAAKFKSCLDGGKFAAKVRKDLGDAQKAGATGTPTFYLGRTDPGGREVKSVRKLVGAQPYASFKDAIDTLLAQN
jgi:protein-disulfide isomerase